MLYTNGDSWSFKHIEYDFPVWPDLVAEHLNMELLNESVGRGSNSRIIDCMKNQWLSGLQPKLIIIGLTTHHRYHIPSSKLGAWSVNPSSSSNDRTNENNSSIRDFIFAHCHQDLDSMFRYYRDIWTMHEFSKNFNCKCLFFQAWDEGIKKLDLLNSDENLFNYIKKFYLPGSFYFQTYFKLFNKFKELNTQWLYEETAMSSYLTKKEIDNTGHPNMLGHEKIAEHVIKLLTRYNLQ